jgi:trimethylamine--corrinoid protein Co-methyltransferase
MDKMTWWARRGLPTIYLGGPSAGATAPVTLVGVIAQSNAEVLSGLVVSQLVYPGAPFVYGGMMHTMDMKSTLHVYGGPEMPLANAEFAEMARFYQMPSFGGAGCTDAVTPGAQAAADISMGCLIAALSGTSIIHDVGCLEAGLTRSFEMITLSNEIIDIVRWLLKGITVNAETLGVDVIGEVGPGGHFLQTEHTLRHFREEIWQPILILMNKDQRETWLDKGGKEMRTKLQEEVQRIVACHQPAPLDRQVDAQIERLLE